MKRQWEQEELFEQWTINGWELAQLGNKSGATRLGFVLLLKYFQQEWRFPAMKNDIPFSVVTYVAHQLNIDEALYLRYDWHRRTISDHRATIRSLFGFREHTNEDIEDMKNWLIQDVLPHEYQEEVLREEAYEWFRRRKIEPPTSGRLLRANRSAANTFEQILYTRTFARLSQETQTALDALLLSVESDVLLFPSQTEESSDEQPEIEEEPVVSQFVTETESEGSLKPSALQHIRMNPGRVGLATMIEEMAKLRRIRELCLPENLFYELSHKVLMIYRNRASIEEPSRLRAHSLPKRMTLLAVLCSVREQEVTDGLVELLIQIIHKIDIRAEKKVQG